MCFFKISFRQHFLWIITNFQKEFSFNLLYVERSTFLIEFVFLLSSPFRSLTSKFVWKVTSFLFHPSLSNFSCVKILQTNKLEVANQWLSFPIGKQTYILICGKHIFKYLHLISVSFCKIILQPSHNIPTWCLLWWAIVSG